MASLLRSGKYFRYFSNAARNLVFNNGNRSDAESLLCARRDEWEIKIHRSLSTFELPLKSIFSETEPVPAPNTALDRALGQADEDIRKFGRIPIKTIENILSTVKQLKNATPQQCVLMIHCCGNLAAEEQPEHRTKLVHEIWNTLEKFQIPLDIKHYNALLRVYLENSHSFDSQEFLTTLIQKDIKPNRVTYQRLISANCLKGDLNGASKILEKMKEENLPINEHIFNALITGHARIGDFENAKGMVNIMQQSGLQPDSGTYEALMCGYALAGDLEGVIATNKECNSKNLYLFQRQWLEVLFTAAVNEHNSIVDYVLSQIPRDSGYNSECLNLIYRLINCEKDDTAFKVFLTMKQAPKDPKLNTSGASFVRHLVKRNRPVNTIIGFCDEIATKGINPRIYFICLSISNTNGNAELTAALLERIKGQKEEITPRMFWSLLDMQGSKAGEKGILDLLRKLIDIDVNFNAQTISNHVIDHLDDPLNVRTTARKLGSSGVPQHIAHQSMLLKALQRRDFEAACNVVAAYDVYLREEHHIAAAKAYASKNDPESFARLLSTILKNKKVVRKDPKEFAVDLYDPFVIEAISIKPSPEEIEKLLSALHKAGIVLSNKAAASIQCKLESSMTNEISELLDKLCAGESFEYQEPTSRAAEFKELWEAVNDGDVDKALKIRCDLQNKAFVFPKGLSVMLIDLLVKKNRLDDAWIIFNDAIAENSNFQINSPVKGLMFANALLKSDRVDDALLVLSKLHVPKEDRNLNVASLAWRFLNYPAEKGDEELLNKFFDLVSNIPGVPMNGLVLSPLIKIKLNRGDLDAAILEMENCATNYGVTPLKNQLMVELIQKEDADRLQKVMDTSFKIHGEANSLYDLVFAFLECGRVRQAQKVIETPGLRARKDRLNLVCERYVEEKRVTELDNLVKITKGLFGIDRVGLYNHLLKAYIQTDDVQGASGLWNRLQEDGLRVSDSFLYELGQYLKGNDIVPPFAVPPEPVNQEPAVEKPPKTRVSRKEREANQESGVAPTSSEHIMKQESTSQEETPKTKGSRNEEEAKVKTPAGKSASKKQFSQALAAGNIEDVLKFKEKMTSDGEKLNVMDKSKVISLALNEQRLDIATSLVKEMLDNGSYPMPFIFRFYAYQLAKAGDNQTLEYLDRTLNDSLKRVINFDAAMATVWNHDPETVNARLDNLMQEINDTVAITDEEKRQEATKNVQTNINRTLLISVLMKNPELLEKCKTLSEEALKINLVIPTASLWVYHLCSGQKEEADTYWNVLKNYSGRIPFRYAVAQCQKVGDTELGRNLVETLSTSQYTTKGVLGVAYSAWIDAHTTNDQTTQAVSVLEEALSKDLKLEEIRRDTLVRLQKKCTATGQNFPFTIPAKKPRVAQQSSSDSD